MAADQSLKIFSICLLSAQKYKAYALFNGEQLIITEVHMITGFFGTWKESLIAEIEEKKAAGFVVIVEELTDNIARHGSQYLLEDQSDADSRTNLYDALDWYFAMADVGNIIFHDEVRKFQISAGNEGSKVDKKSDEKGRTIYSIDWRGFHGGYRAVLLCVVAAMKEPMSERYLKEMFPPVESITETHPLHRIKQALHGHDLKRASDFEAVRGGQK